MKVTKENTGNLTAVLRIDIAQEDYTPKLEEQLKSYRRKANVPGFRPGQAPIGMIKKMYEIPLRAEIIEKAMSDAMYDYIDKEKVRILGYPLANEEKTVIDWNNQKEFTFYFDIALEPEFDINLENIEETYYEIEPSEEMLDNFVIDIQRRFGQFSSPESIEEGDMIYGEIIEVDEEGNVKEGGIKEQTSIFIDKIAQKTIQKKFIGKQKDSEIIFNPSKAFPKVEDKALVLRIKDKEAVNEFNSDVKFIVSSINRVVLHELNEELFEKAYKGSEIKTPEEFRQRAKEDLSQTYKRETDTFFTNEITKKIVEQTAFELPDEFMKRWIASNSQGKLSEEEVQNNYQQYQESLKWQLIESKLTEKYSIEVTKEDIKGYLKEAVIKNYFPTLEDQTPEQEKERMEAIEGIAENMLKNQEQTKQVYEYLFDQKLTSILLEKSKTTKKSVSIEEFTELIQNQTKK
ncbi:MAG: trigger factor [Bacteroidia bacterium]|nr:trigger factor [Bacteroidia bacterium]